MTESTSTPGLCARCGRDPAQHGRQSGEDWYCNTSTNPCFSKYLATRKRARSVTATEWSPKIAALLGERPS